jgi:hypothetical protein
MLKTKTKGLFVDYSEYALLLARTSSFKNPVHIEAITEHVPGEPEETAEFVREFAELKSGSYIPTHCSIYPTDRFIRRFTMDVQAKNKNQNYFSETLSSQFRVDPEKNMVQILKGTDGAEADLEKGLDKELMFVGGPTEQFRSLQQNLLSYAIYPASLEVGTLSTIGGLIDYTQAKGLSAPTLILEITADNSNVFIFRNDILDVSRPISFGWNTMYPVIQQELGLKDEGSAKKIFYSNTFDFTEMGPKLLRKMLKELQASTGFYEVQTGQTIGQIFLSLLPKNLNWVGQILARSLGVDVIDLDFPAWLKSQNITLADEVDVASLDNRWMGLFSLMGDYSAEDKDLEKVKEGSSA